MEAKIDAVDLMRQIDLIIELKGAREASLRISIGIWLIKLAAKIMNMEIVYKYGDCLWLTQLDSRS